MVAPAAFSVEYHYFIPLLKNTVMKMQPVHKYQRVSFIKPTQYGNISVHRVEAVIKVAVELGQINL